MRRHKIDILSPPTSQDALGQPLTWANYKTNIWASKEPLLGNEFYASLTTESKVEVKFRTGYIAGVKNNMRIKHGDAIYEILSAISPKSKNLDLLIYCKEVV